MGSMFSGGGSSSGGGMAASTQAPPNALQQIMTMLDGSGGGGGAPGAATMNPFYRPPSGGTPQSAPSTQTPQAPAPAQRKPFDVTTFNDDGTTAASSIGAGPQISTTPVNKPPTTPSTMSDLSNVIFGNKASAMKSLGSLGGK